MARYGALLYTYTMHRRFLPCLVLPPCVDTIAGFTVACADIEYPYPAELLAAAVADA